MKKIFDYWMPDIDTHFAKVLKKNFKRTGKAEYQFQIREEALKYVKRFERCVDVGANLGLWSKPLSSVFDEVIAFEPLPFAVECLKENTKEKSVTIHEFSLGNVNSTVNMIIWPANTGKSHVDRDSLGTGAIPIKRLDDLNLPYFSFIKLDCEGYELEVLEGALETLKEYKPVIVIEQHPICEFKAGNLLRSIGLTDVFSFDKDYLFIWK